MTVYLVKKQEFIDNDSFAGGWVHDELIAVCSDMQKALQYIDRPNFDKIITRYEVDNPDSETLMENIESYRKN